MKIVIVKKGWLKKKYHFQIIAKNGEMIASGRPYFNRKDCEDTVALLKAEVKTAIVVPSN